MFVQCVSFNVCRSMSHIIRDRSCRTLCPDVWRVVHDGINIQNTETDWKYLPLKKAQNPKKSLKRSRSFRTRLLLWRFSRSLSDFPSSHHRISHQHHVKISLRAINLPSRYPTTLEHHSVRSRRPPHWSVLFNDGQRRPCATPVLRALENAYSQHKQTWTQTQTQTHSNKTFLYAIVLFVLASVLWAGTIRLWPNCRIRMRALLHTTRCW